jgi:hypothetical protein
MKKQRRMRQAKIVNSEKKMARAVAAAQAIYFRGHTAHPSEGRDLPARVHLTLSDVWGAGVKRAGKEELDHDHHDRSVPRPAGVPVDLLPLVPALSDGSAGVPQEGQVLLLSCAP